MKPIIQGILGAVAVLAVALWAGVSAHLILNAFRLGWRFIP